MWKFVIMSSNVQFFVQCLAIFTAINATSVATTNAFEHFYVFFSADIVIICHSVRLVEPDHHHMWFSSCCQLVPCLSWDANFWYLTFLGMLTSEALYLVSRSRRMEE